ncbi:MAG: YggS family pyridoxal phosphate-dependent enzyme [Deltaproteobacteria bacterium]|nr:YggS family pyridoxal phosphate-dependent enzyme [Deltaproteobacteria bacterium]
MRNMHPDEAAARLRAVREAIGEAAERSGRPARDVTLLGASKTVPAALIRVFAEAGLMDFGESYLQEAQGKIDELAGPAPQLRWHFIGHLQTNKARNVSAIFPIIHSLDRLELARELDRRARALGRTIDAYIEVNVSGEESKSGLSPAGLPRFLEDLASLPALNILGLMTMPPYDPDPEASRPFFAALRELRDRLCPGLRGLSMGMSGDFPVAIEEGATVVRVGSALFGARR